MITKLIGFFMFTFCLLIQRGGAHRDAYINVAEGNGFIGTIGSLIVGLIIWWIVITTSNSNKDK